MKGLIVLCTNDFLVGQSSCAQVLGSNEVLHHLRGQIFHSLT